MPNNRHRLMRKEARKEIHYELKKEWTNFVDNYISDCIMFGWDEGQEEPKGILNDSKKN